MNLRHRQKKSFRHYIVPGGSAGLTQLFKNPNTDIKLYAILDYIVDEMSHHNAPLYDYAYLTNVYAPPTLISVGSELPFIKDSSNHLCLTVRLSDMPIRKSFSTVHSTRHFGANGFVVAYTFRLTSIECDTFGIHDLLTNSLDYLYQTLGIMIRNYFKYTTHYKYTAGVFDLPSSEYVELPLHLMLNRLPYHEWGKIRELWTTNMLHPKIAENTAEYFFTHLHNSVTPNYDQASAVIEGMFKKLPSSLDNYELLTNIFPVRENCLSKMVSYFLQHKQLFKNLCMKQELAYREMKQLYRRGEFDENTT